MLKINLLSFREEKQKNKTKKQQCLFFFVLVLILFSTTSYIIAKTRQNLIIKKKIIQAEKDISTFKKKIDVLGKIKIDFENIELNLATINSLQTKKTKILTLLEFMSDSFVLDRMQLESISTSQQGVKIKGIAIDNKTIADFMHNLDKALLFNRVDLKTSRINNNSNGIKYFELFCITKQKKNLDKKTLD